MSNNLPTGSSEATEQPVAFAMPSSWSDQPVLVTGAGGFIGSHLVETLLKSGARVRAFVRYNSRRDAGLLRLLSPELMASCEIIFGDLRDSDAVDKASRDVDTVFHLGALIGIPYSYVHPREVVQTNVTGTLNVLTAAERNKVRKVVNTSTSEVYGTALYTPIDEKHPLQGQSPYSASKIGADKLAQSFYCTFGLQVATIRPFNTFGPRQSARAVIPTIITQALVKDKVHLGSLEPRRDFTFVTDTVDAFLRIAASPESAGREINVGSDAEISIGELAAKIIKMIGREVEISCDTQRVRPDRSEVQQLWADASQAAELIGWKPQVGFDEGLRRTIDWIQSHLELYQVGQYQV
ncbi:MAG TPA: SDR family NAD(P)-dependent oxidoreductase [Pyrinomonadaceae bacterium]